MTMMVSMLLATATIMFGVVISVLADRYEPVVAIAAPRESHMPTIVFGMGLATLFALAHVYAPMLGG